MPFFTNTELQNLPPWIAKQYQEMAQGAEQLGREKYKHYPAERVAPIPEDIQRAHQMATQGIGAEGKLLAEAREGVVRGRHPFSQHVAEYMNPYQQQVIKQIAEEGNRNFKENILPALEANFVKLGQHGSAKHSEMLSRAARDLQHEILGRQREALSTGYQQAGQMYNAQQAREMEAASQLANLAAAQQGSRFSDIAALENQGRYKQQQEQARMDTNYQNWLRELEHPMHRMAFQHAMLNGMPYQGINQTYYQTPATPQMNVLGQMGPLAGNIWAMRQMAGR